MKIKSIRYPTPLETIKDIEDDNIDVFIELENHYIYTLVVGTPLNLLSLMKKDNIDFSEPGRPFIIVEQLTKETIERAIKEYSKDDAYWLKMYYLCSDFDIDTVNDLDKKSRDEYLND